MGGNAKSAMGVTFFGVSTFLVHENLLIDDYLGIGTPTNRLDDIGSFSAWSDGPLIKTMKITLAIAIFATVRSAT